MTTDPEEQKKLKPLMLTMMYLEIPKILIKPSLEEIQSAFSQVIELKFYLEYKDVGIILRKHFRLC